MEDVEVWEIVWGLFIVLYMVIYKGFLYYRRYYGGCVIVEVLF